jgi:hypothetical protein
MTKVIRLKELRKNQDAIKLLFGISNPNLVTDPDPLLKLNLVGGSAVKSNSFAQKNFGQLISRCLKQGVNENNA